MTDQTGAESIDGFRTTFGISPRVCAQAPGRVNILGEHTDYNEGWVLPFAINQKVAVAAGPSHDGRMTLHSAALNETVSFSTDVGTRADDQRWQNYVRGIVAGLGERGVRLSGARLWIGGNLPIGCGLSSSAALSVASTLALLRLAGTDADPLAIARIAKQAENRFAGTPCGIMDPFVSLHARAGHAVHLDCRTLRHEQVPIEFPETEWLVIDSGVRHQLSDGGFAQRVSECNESAAAIALREPGVQSLRDVTPEMVRTRAEGIDPMLVRRARHVASENERVLRMVEALRQGRLVDAGTLLWEGHESLRDDFEVSCPEIEAIISELRSTPGIIGARLTGGGFGGSVLALAQLGTGKSIESTWNDGRFTKRLPRLRLVTVSPVECARSQTVAPSNESEPRSVGNQ